MRQSSHRHVQSWCYFRGLDDFQDAAPGIRDSGSGTRDSGFGIRDPGLRGSGRGSALGRRRGRSWMRPSRRIVSVSPPILETAKRPWSWPMR